MEKLKDSIFENLQTPSDADVFLKDKTLYVTKWNWDYQDCLAFQKNAQNLISKNRVHKVFIFCNHPHCFTLGRGNERGQDNLIDFPVSMMSSLKFPVHKIHRGGGITFHYPGQWIFYPIVSINEKNTLEDHMCWLLKSVKNILKDHFELDQVMAAKKLMGVWFERKKLASIGVGLNRFVSEHGIALNLVFDKNMFEEVHKINPCGMTPTTYTCLSELKDVEVSKIIEEFHHKYLSAL